MNAKNPQNLARVDHVLDIVNLNEYKNINYKMQKVIISFFGRPPDHCKAAVTEKNRIFQRTFFLLAWTQQIKLTLLY